MLIIIAGSPELEDHHDVITGLDKLAHRKESHESNDLLSHRPSTPTSGNLHGPARFKSKEDEREGEGEAEATTC